MVGAAVGLITNYLAILMIFKPQQPTRYLGVVTYQGMFAKRQNDIARDTFPAFVAQIEGVPALGKARAK